DQSGNVRGRLAKVEEGPVSLLGEPFEAGVRGESAAGQAGFHDGEPLDPRGGRAVEAVPIDGGRCSPRGDRLVGRGSWPRGFARALRRAVFDGGGGVWNRGRRFAFARHAARDRQGRQVIQWRRRDGIRRSRNGASRPRGRLVARKQGSCVVLTATGV